MPAIWKIIARASPQAILCDTLFLTWLAMMLPLAVWYPAPLREPSEGLTSHSFARRGSATTSAAPESMVISTPVHIHQGSSTTLRTSRSSGCLI